MKVPNGGDFIIFNPTLTSVSFLAVLKIAIIIGVLLHLVFSFVVVRQTSLLGRTLKTKVSPLLSIAALVGLASSVFALIIAVFLL